MRGSVDQFVILLDKHVFVFCFVILLQKHVSQTLIWLLSIDHGLPKGEIVSVSFCMVGRLMICHWFLMF